MRAHWSHPASHGTLSVRSPVQCISYARGSVGTPLTACYMNEGNVPTSMIACALQSCLTGDIFEGLLGQTYPSQKRLVIPRSCCALSDLYTTAEVGRATRCSHNPCVPESRAHSLSATRNHVFRVVRLGYRAFVLAPFLPMSSVRGRTVSTVFCHLSWPHALLLHARQPLLNLQLIKRSQLTAFPTQVTNRKVFCQRFCQMAERSACGHLFLPRTLPMRVFLFQSWRLRQHPSEAMHFAPAPRGGCLFSLTRISNHPFRALSWCVYQSSGSATAHLYVSQQDERT